MLQKMLEKDFFNCCYRDDDVTNDVDFFEKLSEKWLKYVFFLKVTLWQLGKRFSRSYFSFSKVKITYKLNIIIGYMLIG